MIKRVLGRTGFEVTALGLGCFQLTGEFSVNPQESAAIVDYALTSGINLFDTAEMYGCGESEEIVGRGTFAHSEKKAFVSTKVGYLNSRTVTRCRRDQAFVDPVEIKRAIKHSCWLLRRDCLDICMIHEPDWAQWQIDYSTGDSVILSVLEELKKEGVIANIGVGGVEFLRSTDMIKTGRIDAALVANGISLLARPMFKELIPAAKKHNVGIMVGACFGQNNPYLTGIRTDDLPKLLESPDPKLVAMGKKLEVIYGIAKELNMNMFELGIRYVLAFEDIHSNVVGARLKEHLATNIGIAEKGPLPAAYVKDINDVQDKYEIDGDLEIAKIMGIPQGFIAPELTGEE